MIPNPILRGLCSASNGLNVRDQLSHTGGIGWISVHCTEEGFVCHFKVCSAGPLWNKGKLHLRLICNRICIPRPNCRNSHPCGTTAEVKLQLSCATCALRN